MNPGPAGPRPLPHRIILIGFMGAGKSTVGRILAARLGWRFVDIDETVTREHRLSIAEIFSAYGEAYFRDLELQATRAALQQQETVIAMGGGAIDTEAVRKLLFTSRDTPEVSGSVTIYLEAALPELLVRCQPAGGSAVRPLLAGPESPAARLERRLPHYRAANHTVSTARLTPEGVVLAILNLLRLPASI